MTREQWGWVIWGAWFLLFVLCELPAVAKVVPWPSLSATVWDLEQRWTWTSIPLIGGLAVLAVHLVRARSVQQGDETKTVEKGAGEK